MASLKTDNWDINGNGFTGALAIKSINGDGSLGSASTAFGNKILGFWDEAARKITFLRLVNPNDPASFQVYTGYLMSDDATLAGSFEAFQGGGATAERSVFGWFARLPATIK